MPKDEKATTKGFAFVEFTTEEAAQAAVEKADGYRLDKNHIFKVNPYDDLMVPEDRPRMFSRFAEIREGSRPIPTPTAKEFRATT